MQKWVRDVRMLFLGEGCKGIVLVSNEKEVKVKNAGLLRSAMRGFVCIGLDGDLVVCAD